MAVGWAVYCGGFWYVTAAGVYAGAAGAYPPSTRARLFDSAAPGMVSRWVMHYSTMENARTLRFTYQMLWSLVPHGVMSGVSCDAGVLVSRTEEQPTR